MDLWSDKLSQGRHLAHDNYNIGHARHDVEDDHVERSPLDYRPYHRDGGQEARKYRPPFPDLFGPFGKAPQLPQPAHCAELCCRALRPVPVGTLALGADAGPLALVARHPLVPAAAAVALER